ncbi:MAG: hypothetical protein JWM32_62 [Verrucomicrobia bacterium]|nr:hypothetical protein [Verrucomicrobiota bacterium]
MRRCRLVRARAFTLVEVIVAVGMLAVTTVGLVAVIAANGRTASELLRRNQADALGDAITVELWRLRELTGNLSALALLVPTEETAEGLRLVASIDGLKVVRESDADDPDVGIRVGDRFFLVELRRLERELVFVPSAGCLAVSVEVSWPYQLRAGVGSSSTTIEKSSASTTLFTVAITP